MCTPSNARFLGPTRIHIPNNISIGSAVFCSAHECDPILLHPFNGLFSRTTWVSRHQIGKPFWIILEQETMGWQWHQLDRMQIICHQTNSVKALKEAHECDRQTNHATPSVTIGRIYVCSTMMQHNKLITSCSRRKRDVKRQLTN